MPDGSWKREGKPEMMVYQDSAQLNFPKEKMVSCHADHSQMAKLRRGESGAYPDIKRAIKQALLHVAEDQANAGLSRLQLRLGGKAPIEEHWRHNEDDIKKPRPERPPFLAENSHLDDDQSLGSSNPDPQGKKIDILHERDIVLNPSPPVSDGRKQGFRRQDSETISDSTIIPPSKPNMSRDGGETPKGDAKTPKATMQHVTDTLSDRRSAPSSPVGKESSNNAMGNVKDSTLRLELCSASKEGDGGKVRSLLAQGCSIHESSQSLVDHEKDAFLLAAINGRLDVVKLLLEHNCDVSKRSLRGSTALHLISSDPEIKPKPVIESLVTLLLEHGLPLEARTSGGSTALSTSAFNGKISIAECLLEHGADILSTDNCGYTALHWAAQEGYHEVAALLIFQGADINSTDNVGYTALHWAAQEGYHEIVALLISKGAPLETRTVDFPGRPPCTPLHLSCYAGNGSGETARLLLQAGAAKEAITGTSSHRILHTAAREGNLEVVNELLAFGVAINAADKDNRCALHLAKRWGHWRIIEALLAKGATPLLINNYGVPPSRETWNPNANISQKDKDKCLELLDDAEKAWLEKRRQGKEKRRRKK